MAPVCTVSLLHWELGLTYQKVISTRRGTALIGNRETCHKFIIHRQTDRLATGGWRTVCTQIRVMTPPPSPTFPYQQPQGSGICLYLEATLEISGVEEVVLRSTANGLHLSIMGHDRKTGGKHGTARPIWGHRITSKRVAATLGNRIKVR